MKSTPNEFCISQPVTRTELKFPARSEGFLLNYGRYFLLGPQQLQLLNERHMSSSESPKDVFRVIG